MNIKRLLLFSLVLVCLPLILSAQSNTVIDELLEKTEADWGKTSYMVLSAAELISENETIPEVLAMLSEQQWNLPSKLSEDPITLGEYSYMLMEAFNIPGGIMYRILPGPRYAARELSYLKFIDKDKSPYRTLSGEEVLRIMGRVMEWKEAGL
ncbi:MAG: hypothetical protein PF693_00230 [Spirochaetia bacterium]|jgi:hypothetical protein|nr:hypothetical protein [Spirochaetia bacterium]